MRASRFFKSVRCIQESTNFAHSVGSLLHSQKKTVAIFDLDNTVLLTQGYQPTAPSLVQGYGSDFWFSAMYKQLDSTSLDFKKLYMMLISEYCNVQHHAQHATPEPCVPDMLTRLKEANIPIIGLTARSSRLSSTTTESLKKLGIQFSGYGHPVAKLDIPAKLNEDDVVYHHGKVYCSGRSKKECLHVFLKTDTGQQFFSGAKQVFFMDDSRVHCEDVYDCLTENKLEPVIVHYTYVDKHVPKANMETMQAEAKKFTLNMPLQYPQ